MKKHVPKKHVLEEAFRMLDAAVRGAEIDYTKLRALLPAARRQFQRRHRINSIPHPRWNKRKIARRWRRRIARPHRQMTIDQ